MKRISTFILVCTAAAPLLSADMVRVRAMFIEADAETVITKAECDADTFRGRPGVTVLAATTGLARSGNPSHVSVDESPAPNGDTEGLNRATNAVSLRVLPRVEGD